MEPGADQYLSMFQVREDLPAPVGIDDDFAIDIGTACSTLSCTTLPGKLGVGFRLLRSNDPG